MEAEEFPASMLNISSQVVQVLVVRPLQVLDFVIQNSYCSQAIQAASAVVQQQTVKPTHRQTINHSPLGADALTYKASGTAVAALAD